MERTVTRVYQGGRSTPAATPESDRSMRVHPPAPAVAHSCPQRGALDHFHCSIVEGDRAALETLAEHALPVLVQQLRRAFRRSDNDQLQDAADDALMDYARAPQRFDPSSGDSLDRFLYRAAWRNVANSLRKDLRRRRRETRYANETACWNSPETTTIRLHTEMARRTLERGIDGVEREALELWFDGERRTGALAEVLGFGALQAPEQRRLVKRFKDRNMKRLARLLRVSASARPPRGAPADKKSECRCRTQAAGADVHK
jgi:DNA-directed RNA polymerase specialized sigma24 family protein